MVVSKGKKTPDEYAPTAEEFIRDAKRTMRDGLPSCDKLKADKFLRDAELTLRNALAQKQPTEGGNQVNEAKQKAMQDVVDAAGEVMRQIKGPEGRKLWNALVKLDRITAETESTASTCNPVASERAKVGDVVRWEFCDQSWEFIVDAVNEQYVLSEGVMGQRRYAPHGLYTIVKRAEPKRTPQVGEFWRITDGVRKGRVGVIKRAREGVGDLHISFAGYPFYLPVNLELMEFVAPARKEGEFKAGDIVEFAGMEWRVSSSEPEKIVGTYHIRLGHNPKHVWALPGTIKLKVPVEMQ